MPTDEEMTQAEEQAVAPMEGEAPPPPPELPLEWAYMEGGTAQDRGVANCVIEDKRLYFKCKSGPPFDLKYSEIEKVEDLGVNLLLTMRDGSAFELSKMARMRFARASKALKRTPSSQKGSGIFLRNSVRGNMW